MASLKRESPDLIGSRIAELRKEMGLNQQELADKINVSRALISEWECGDRKPDVSSWIKLAEFFGVSTDYISGTSNHRIYKGQSFSDKLDIKRLNEKGVDMLFEFYHMLLKHEEFVKKQNG